MPQNKLANTVECCLHPYRPYRKAPPLQKRRVNGVESTNSTGAVAKGGRSQKRKNKPQRRES